MPDVNFQAGDSAGAPTLHIGQSPQVARQAAPQGAPAPQAQSQGNSGSQAAQLQLSQTAQSIYSHQSLAERKEIILAQLRKPVLSLADKDEILKVLQASRRDGSLGKLVGELQAQSAESGENRLQQL
ncbi:MAG: hypothetical protein JOY51_00175, partial [Nevskia sp.]|nr:hypothetical protein [Nevskia sp.]